MKPCIKCYSFSQIPLLIIFHKNLDLFSKEIIKLP